MYVNVIFCKGYKQMSNIQIKTHLEFIINSSQSTSDRGKRHFVPGLATRDQCGVSKNVSIMSLKYFV